jgi:hypothetical protein
MVQVSTLLLEAGLLAQLFFYKSLISSLFQYITNPDKLDKSLIDKLFLP